MIQSEKIISAVSDALIPSLFSFLPDVRPMFPLSIIKAVELFFSPTGPVLKIATAKSPDLPWVIKFLVPFKTHLFPFFTAVDAIFPESDPVLGSVSAHAPIIFPVASNLRYFL